MDVEIQCNFETCTEMELYGMTKVLDDWKDHSVTYISISRVVPVSSLVCHFQIDWSISCSATVSSLRLGSGCRSDYDGEPGITRLRD